MNKLLAKMPRKIINFSNIKKNLEQDGANNAAKVAPQVDDLKNSKLIKNKITSKPSTSSASTTADATTSKYFSPIKTRNRKIEAVAKEVVKPPAVKIEAQSVKSEKNSKIWDTKKDLLLKSEIGEPVADNPFEKVFKKIEEEFNKNIKLEIKKKKSAAGTDDEKPLPSNKRKSEESAAFDVVADVHEAVDSKQSKWEPENWRITLKNIREMRREQSAPVDTMGCHKCHDPAADEKTQRYQILVSLMLSSQTKDATNYSAMSRLKEYGLTPENIFKSDPSVLESLICPVSFYKVKAKNIQKTTLKLLDEYGGDIPRTVKELTKLPGVGPKMAHICMKVAWNIVSGIGVDVHVHRISNRVGWVSRPTKNPEQTRVELESFIPSDLWPDVNNLLVGFGQTICTPTNPKCAECSNRNICPSANLKKK